jgi:hypothetical protein
VDVDGYFDSTKLGERTPDKDKIDCIWKHDENGVTRAYAEAIESIGETRRPIIHRTIGVRLFVSNNPWPVRHFLRALCKDRGEVLSSSWVSCHNSIKTEITVGQFLNFPAGTVLLVIDLEISVSVFLKKL